MNQKNMKNSHTEQLPDLFKEIQDIRYGRAKPKEEPIKEEIKFNRIQVINHKFNAIGAIIGILFLILFTTSIHSNYIFATSEEEKIAISEFEKNKKALNMMDIISSNISESTKKEIITKGVTIDYETEYIENDTLPKDEEKIVQVGKFGAIEQTVIKSYENDELISEDVIGEVKLSDPTTQIIEVGTSEYLKEKSVHIGDIMYTKERMYMYKEPKEDAQTVCIIYDSIDVKLVSEKDGWCYVTVDGLEGYVKGDLITSEAETPGIEEKSRKKRLLLTVNPEMQLNKPSGLTKEDFKKVFYGNQGDKEKIFENNAELFYEIEQKYNINGIFLASIAIHESNWGTSNIAMQKKNLFGFGSFDFSAFESSTTFESYQYGIDYVAKVLVKYYINAQGTPIYDGETAVGTYYNGPTVAGVNVRYASDQNWSTRVFNIMKALYEKI